MPDVMPALEQLFEKDESGMAATPMEPIPAVPPINETQRLIDQVTEAVGKKPKRLSEMI